MTWNLKMAKTPCILQPRFRMASSSDRSWMLTSRRMLRRQSGTVDLENLDDSDGIFLPKNIWCHYIICRSWSCNLEKIGSIIFKSPNPKSAFGRKPFEGIRMTPWQRIPESNVISTGPRTSKLKNNGNIYMFVIVTLLKNANHPRCNWYSGIYGCL